MAISRPDVIPDCAEAKPSTREIEPNAVRATGLWLAIRRWIDTSAVDESDEAHADRIDWLRAAPFVAMHLACLGVLWVGVSPLALIVATSLYAVRMFALTGFYHRYFSHRTFRTSRSLRRRPNRTRNPCDQTRKRVRFQRFRWPSPGTRTLITARDPDTL